MNAGFLNSPKFLHFVIIILVATVSFLGYLAFFNNPTQKTDFNLLDFQIAQLETEQFHDVQERLSISYSGMRDEINNTIANESGEYGFYFEDLTTGAWIGVNERMEFIPASLFKLPAIIAVVKKIEEREISLDDKITLAKNDIERNFVSGSLGSRGVGYNLTVREALIYTINESDNTALNALAKKLTYAELTEAYVATSLPWPKFTGRVEDNLVSPKQYMNVFRSLYYSSYLRRTYSQFILSLLVEAQFDSALPAGIDSDIKVANKVGFYNTQSKNFHDCGIVYVPEKPYMVCIMSSNTTQDRFNAVASRISKIVFDYAKE